MPPEKICTNRTPRSTSRRANSACLAKWSAILAIDAIQRLDLGRLLVDVERFGGCRLHAIGQFEVFNPRGQFRLGRILLLRAGDSAGPAGPIGGAGRRRSCAPSRVRLLIGSPLGLRNVP